MCETIKVGTKRSYEVLVGREILADTGALVKKVKKPCKAVIISDDIVAPIYMSVVKTSLKSQGFECDEFVIANGEESKSLDVAGKIYDFLAQKKLSRSDLLIALGGGVVGDLCGFAAATYLRGVDFVQIPTTFLAQIDSSVGGKTAVNIESGKNLVGAFWQPILVICDIDTLKTLSSDRFSDGVGEAIKYGAIVDKSLFELIEQGGLKESLAQVVSRCIEIKRDIVEKDEFDLGLRQLLNFGHTIGHAIEKCSRFGISHGKAVGIGMNMITALSEKVGITPKGCAKRIEALLQKNAMPTECEYPTQALLDVIKNDKKVAHGGINLIVLEQIGKAIIHNISLEKLEEFFNGH